jgi:cold shock CspA family protein/uncharacterized LabA/DUF88 family protein
MEHGWTEYEQENILDILHDQIKTYYTQLSSTAVANHVNEIGTVKFLGNGFGYIKQPGKKNDVFFHWSKLAKNIEFDQLRVGQPFEFEIAPGRRPGTFEAVNIKLISAITVLVTELEELNSFVDATHSEKEIYAALLLNYAEEVLNALNTNKDENELKSCKISNIAFYLYKFLPGSTRYKKYLVSCINVFIKSYLSFIESQLSIDFESCDETLQNILIRAYGNLYVPRAAKQVALANLLMHFENKRQALCDDTFATKEFLIRNFPGVWHIDTRGSQELKEIKTIWVQEATKHCPEAAQVVMRQIDDINVSSVIATIIIEVVPTTKEVNDPQQRELYSRLKLLTTGTEKKIKEKIKSLFNDDIEFRKPDAILRSSRRHLEPQCNLALAQFSNGNYPDALRTLDRLIGQDNINNAFWEWSGYIRTLLKDYTRALRDFQNVRMRMGEKAPFSLLWNIACCQYHLGNLEAAYEPMTKAVGGEDSELGMALALESGDKERLLSLLINADELEFIVYGYIVAFESRIYNKLPQYIEKMQIMAEAMQDDFQPLPIEERLDDEEIGQTLTYFMKYFQIIQNGIRHFSIRLHNQPERGYLFYRCLGTLYQMKGELRSAFEHFKQGCDATLASRVNTQVKVEQIVNLLELCDSHDLKDEGKSILDSYKLFLNGLDKRLFDEHKIEDYRGRFAKGSEEVTKDVSKVSSTLLAEESLNYNEAARKNRLSTLNFHFGRAATAYKIKEQENEAHEYCDLIEQIYGAKGQPGADSLRSIVDKLLQFTATSSLEEKEKCYEDARTEVPYLQTKLSILGQEEVDNLKLVERLPAIIMHASMEIGRVQAPSIEVLSTFLPDDFDLTSLVVKVSNKTDAILDNVILRLDTETRSLTVLEEEVVVPRLVSREERIVLFKVKRSFSEDSVSLQISNPSFSYENVPYTLRNSIRTVVPFQTFTKLNAGYYVVDIAVTPEHPENFHGRDQEIEKVLESIHLQAAGRTGAIFLDGIRRVGKSSIINFVVPSLPDWIVSVRADMTRIPTDNAGVFFHNLSTRISRELTKEPAATAPYAREDYVAAPMDTFDSSIEYFVRKYPERRILLIIDEFQKIIESIDRLEKGQGHGLDNRVLDLFQGFLEQRALLFLLSGSVRLQHLNKMRRHAFFGRVQQIPVSFVSFEATKAIIEKPVSHLGISYDIGAINRVWELTRGYASIIQKLGDEALKLIGADRRQIVVQDDIDTIAYSFLDRADIFRWWWDEEYLGDADARVIESFLNLSEDCTKVSNDLLMNECRYLGSDVYLAIQNLRDQQVFAYDAIEDSYEIKGALLKQWLPRMLRERQGDKSHSGYCALAIDHENFYIPIKNQYIALRGKEPDNKDLEHVIRQVVAFAEEKAHVVAPVATAVWKNFGSHREMYESTPQRFSCPPADRTGKDAADVTLLREAVVEIIERELLLRERIGTVVLVTGDHRFAPLVSRLQKRDTRVFVLSWKASLAEELFRVTGQGFVKYLDDIIQFT